MTKGGAVPNPWRDLPESPEYVLPCDLSAVRAHNARCGVAHRYHLNLLPEPYFGRPKAPVVVLMSNPAVGEEDGDVHRMPAFVDAARRSMLHALSDDGPFLHLRDGVPGGGRRYWLQRTRELAEHLGGEAIGRKRVQAGLLVLQLSPYHSHRFKPAKPALPSQTYTVQLLEDAIDREALIVVLRGRQFWEQQCSRLESVDAALRIHASNPRCAALTAGNLKGRFEDVVRVLRQMPL